jgi:DNA-binding response OmpR family regulator
VLVIEDQPVAAMQLTAALRTLGREPVLVPDGTAAWEELMRNPYSIVVSDWQVPGITGLQLCERIRARGGNYVYFILVSVVAITRETRQAALKAGVDDFLAKPVNPDELELRLHVAERILGFTAQVRQLESFLPICSYCKKVRDDKNYWSQVEEYLNERVGTRFSHGICPDCYERVVAPQLRDLDSQRPPSL